MTVLQQLLVVTPLGRFLYFQFSAHFEGGEAGTLFFEFLQVVPTGPRDDVGFSQQHIHDKFVGRLYILDGGLDVLFPRNFIVLFLSLVLAIEGDGLYEL